MLVDAVDIIAYADVASDDSDDGGDGTDVDNAF